MQDGRRGDTRTGAPAGGPRTGGARMGGPMGGLMGGGGKPSSWIKPLLRSTRYLKPHIPLAVGAFFSLAISSGANLVVPMIQKMVFDRGIGAGELRAVLLGAAGIVAIALGRSLFTFLQGFLAAKVSQGVAFDLRNELYDHIQNLSFSYHDQAQTGQLLTRATSDVELVRGFIGMGFVQLLSALIMMAGSLAVLFSMNWLLTLSLVPLMIGLMLIFGYFAKKGRPLFRVMQQKLAVLNSRLQENMIGARVVKSFTREDYEEERFAVGNAEMREIGIRVRRIFAFAMPLIFTLSSVGSLLVVWIGGYQVLGDNLTIGELVAFQSYMMMVMFPIMMLGGLMMTVSQAAAGAERIFEILDARSEVQEKPEATPLRPMREGLEFRNVTFRYFGSSDPVLREVSISASPGETVALLGATGSGKSTVINLIPRFYDVSEGCITIDGTDIRDVTLESLRTQIGIVLQETVLFGGTIHENIAYGKPDATDAEIEEAARAADAHEFIASFADKYDTVVGERGVTLSGGQKQRVAIARALLVQPTILILDDSTSSVDFSTEVKIRRALEELQEGRLCFVIAQRISTVQQADKIVLLDQGRVAAVGTHRELINDSPLYAEIFYSQLQPDQSEPDQSEPEQAGREQAEGEARS